MTRVKRRTVGSYTLTATATDEEGAQQTITAPVSVTIYDGAGVEIASGTPLIAGGTLVYEVPAATLPKFDTYSLVWSGLVDAEVQEWATDVEIVGGHHFELSELRKKDRAFQNATKYPAEALKEAREWAEDKIEGPKAAQRAFVPRGRRAVLDGSGPDYAQGYAPLVYSNDYTGLKVPDFDVRELYSVTINGVALTAEELAEISIDDNWLYRAGGWPSGSANIRLHYAYGLDRAPRDIRRAALILAREDLVESDIPGRATATSAGDQTFRITIAGRDGVTGLPEVDAAISQWGRAGFGIGAG